jgi:UTP:GlnB (protein PII) uridylyltransferase
LRRSRICRPGGDPRLCEDSLSSERRLDALYILTHADIRGTSPKVWNAWRGKLLEDLYFSALRVLQGEAPRASGSPDRQEEARHLLRYFGLRDGVENDFWARLDTVYFTALSLAIWQVPAFSWPPPP